jgi:PleD family two-component response regulator
LREVAVNAAPGATESADHPGTLEQLIRAVDVKLYQAKHEGKGRVVY